LSRISSIRRLLHDTWEDERAMGIAAGLAWLGVAEAAVVYTDRGISAGMREGIEAAARAALGSNIARSTSSRSRIDQCQSKSHRDDKQEDRQREPEQNDAQKQNAPSRFEVVFLEKAEPRRKLTFVSVAVLLPHHVSCSRRRA
jgi:hypothetical protein